jgi:hypothetical protein
MNAGFDVMTPPPSQRGESLAWALLVELPPASVGAWLSYHTQ